MHNDAYITYKYRDWAQVLLVSEMNFETLVKDLKNRSGKTIKCIARKIFKKEEESVEFSIICFTNRNVKLCLILHGLDATHFEVAEGKTFLLKNLEFHDMLDNIPVFKLSKNGSLKQSKAELKLEALIKVDEDPTNFLGLNVLQRVGQVPTSASVDASSSASSSNSQKTSVNMQGKVILKKEVLSLNEFLEVSVGKFEEKHVVEVSTNS